MLVGGVVQEVAGLPQILDNHRVGLGDVLAGVRSRLFGEHASGVHRRQGLDSVAGADHVVFLAVAGRGVNAAGSGFEGDVGAQEDRADPVGEQRVPILQPLQVRAAPALHNFVVADADVGQGPRHQLGGHDIGFAADADGAVLEIGMDRRGQVRGERPGRGGPDDVIHRAFETLGKGVNRLELHVDRRRRVVVILDLGLGEGRPARAAPVDGLEALVHVSALVHFGEHADDGGHVARIEGEVRVLPFARDAQAAEAFPVDVHVLEREIPASPTDLDLAEVLRLVAEIAHHLVLDGQPVAVPAGDEGGVVTRHLLGLYDQILEHLVEGGAGVELAVGVGRTVVKHELGPARSLFPHAPI